MSSTYRAAPVTLATPSLRGTLLPTDGMGRAGRLLRSGRFQRLAQDPEGLLDLRLRYGQGRGDPERVAVEAALPDEEEPLLCFLENAVAHRLVGRAVAGRLVHDELDRLHQAQAAHVADVLREAALQLLQALAQDAAHPLGVAGEVVLLDDLDGRVGGGAGDGVAAEGRDRQRLQGGRDLRRGDRDGEGQAVGDSLGHRHDVRLDSPVLDAPPLPAGAAEAGLDLVADEDPAVLLDDADGDLEVLRRRRDEPADALDRLREETGDAAGRRRADDVLDVLRAGGAAALGLQTERAAVAVRRHRVLDAGDLG